MNARTRAPTGLSVMSDTDVDTRGTQMGATRCALGRWHWSGDRCNRSALYHAALGGHEATAALILGEMRRSPSDGAVERGGGKGRAAGGDANSDNPDHTPPKEIDTPTGPDYRTPLHAACEQGHVRVADMLLDAGASMRRVDSEGQTGLMLAARNGREGVVAMLLDRGAKVDFVDNYARTALTHAAEGGHEDVMRVLIDAGAAVDKHDREGETALIKASIEGHVDAVSFLIQERAALNATNIGGMSALTFAAAEGHADVAEVLIAGRDQLTDRFEGADVGLKDDLGRTALFYGAMIRAEGVVELLIDRGIDVNAANSDGDTALIIASSDGNEKLVEMLLEAGASVRHKNTEGRSALMHAAERGHETVVEMLACALVRERQLAE